MRVLVTGATGFVASHLVPALAADGHEVIAAAHDLDRCATAPGVSALELDLTSFASDQLPQVDAIVHLAQANVPFPDGAGSLFAVNTASTAALLGHARRTGATTFVYASSASVYGFGDRPWSEDDVPGSTDFYSATKLASERLLGAYADGLATWSLRLVAPYGPGQRNRLIPRLVESVRSGRPVTLNVDGRPRMNPIEVGDVVEVIRAILVSGPPGNHVLNVAGPDAVSIEELAEAIGRAIGSSPVFELGEGVSGDLVCSNDRMRALLGARDLVGLEAGLGRLASALPEPSRP